MYWYSIMDNKFITVEGLDGSGKTTVIFKIVQYLNDHGVTKVLVTHEPGGTPIADVLRALIKYGLENEFINDITELLMIYAARFQLLDRVIKPALCAGYWVIGDRYDLSSQAYQGGGRGVDMSLLHILSNLVIKDVYPDLTLYLDVDPEISLLRIKNRDKLDRIERESLNFFNRVRSCYQRLVIAKKNIIMIDANQSLEDTVNSIYLHLDQQFSNFYK